MYIQKEKINCGNDDNISFLAFNFKTGLWLALELNIFVVKSEKETEIALYENLIAKSAVYCKIPTIYLHLFSNGIQFVYVLCSTYVHKMNSISCQKQQTTGFIY